ncbi:MAG TPA: TolC family protein [Vicinamibacterales bacterium]|nr:TolC family protein [Vicinamibacterales bacterium]
MSFIRSFSGRARLAAAGVAFGALFASGTALSEAGQAAPAQPAGQPVAQTPTSPETGPVRRFSVDEAVTMALEHNLNLRAERLNPQIQDLGIAQARAAFTPSFFTTIRTSSDESPPESFLSGSGNTITDERFSSNLGVRQQLPWGGGSYQVSWAGSRRETTGFTSFNPQLGSNLDAQITQPLLRNFRIDSLRQQLLLNTKQREIADVQLREAVAQTTRTVRNAYWDLVAAVANHQVQLQSLELARESLRNNRTRVEVGTMAPIDIVEAEAEVARNEEAVIVSEANIRSFEDRLRALIADPTQPDFWSMRIEPTDQPVMTPPKPIDLDAAVRNALDNRTDIIQTRKQLESADINIRYFTNQRLPDVNLEAAYGLTGLGGTEYEFDRTGGFPPPIIGRTNRSFQSVLSDVFRNQFPSWTLGVSVGYPIGRSQAEAGLARARLENTRARTSLANLQLQVTTSVREAARQVNTNLKRVQATQVARGLAEQRLAAEQKKFNVGMSTTFIVFQAQRELTNARNNELRAIIDYNRSIVDFEAIQQIPLGGSASVNVASTGTAGVR